MRNPKKQLLPLEHRIAELISEEQFRPFDSRLKEILRKPGVLQKLLDSVAGLPQIDLGTATSNGLKSEEFKPLGEEYRTTQITFRADIVGELGPGHILHVEQQTKHSRKPALRRMMQYGALIASYYDFQKLVTQLYYYTGDKPAGWANGDYRDGRVFNGNGSVTNSFIFIDASRHDAWAMLRGDNFFYAMLGLLAATIPYEAAYCSELVKTAYNKFSGDELREVLVTCVVVGQLRGRGSLVYPHILEPEADRMFDEPFFQWMDTVIRSRNADHYADIANAVNRIKEVVPYDLPGDFLRLAMQHMTRDQVMAVREATRRYETLPEILEQAGVPVAYRDGEDPQYFVEMSPPSRKPSNPTRSMM